MAVSCTQSLTPANSTAQSSSVAHPLTQAEVQASILKESQPGGKLDFFTAIKGHEYDGRQIRPGIYASNLEAALYSWGSAVKDAGVKTVEEAYEIYSAFQEKPATPRDKDTIKMGFTKQLDK